MGPICKMIICHKVQVWKDSACLLCNMWNCSPLRSLVLAWAHTAPSQMVAEQLRIIIEHVCWQKVHQENHRPTTMENNTENMTANLMTFGLIGSCSVQIQLSHIPTLINYARLSRGVTDPIICHVYVLFPWFCVCERYRTVAKHTISNLAMAKEE